MTKRTDPLAELQLIADGRRLRAQLDDDPHAMADYRAQMRGERDRIASEANRRIRARHPGALSFEQRGMATRLALMADPTVEQPRADAGFFVRRSPRDRARLAAGRRTTSGNAVVSAAVAAAVADQAAGLVPAVMKLAAARAIHEARGRGEL